MRLRAEQKLFLSYLAVITAGVAALTIGVRTTLRQHLTEIVAEDLRREVNLARFLAGTRPGLSSDSLADWLGALSGRRVTVVARDGTVLGDSDLRPSELAHVENHAHRPEIRAALAGHVGEDIRTSHTLGFDQLYIAAPGPNGEAIRLSVPLLQVSTELRRVETGIFGVGVLAAVVAGLLSLGFSFAITRRLRALAALARGMAGGDLTLRARARQDDELGALAGALDALAEELQRRLGELEGERAEMQALIDSMSEGVIALGPDGAVRRANPAAQHIFSLPGPSRGSPPEAVARGKGFLDLVRRAREHRPVPPTELAVAQRQLLASAQPLPDGGAVLVFRDVSELRRLEGVRRDFVANASHELKTPLTAIRGYAETLLDEDLPAELRRQFLGTVKTNADRLQAIVDDLLDLSRIESGGYRVEPESVSLADLAREAWAPLRETAEATRAELRVDVPPDCEIVHADPAALRQVFSNLFSNSLRHMQGGGTIEVSAAPAGSPSPGRWIEVAVRDTGAGIAAVHLPRIFERFYRADAARTRAEGGTGLGLAIVRNLVERHGGAVSAESRLGEGTTIRFTLPAPGA
ncbi:MAG TPA: ATP-binding protein [Longimicrobiaceae bacterium]|nr:ATP-binding protein [Longimicrobiaceae bacterium]